MLKVIKSLVIVLLLSAIVVPGFGIGPVGYTTDGYKVKTVVIDAGHGGHDPGTVGRSAKEKNVVLKLALELGKRIKEEHPDVKVLYTRSTDKFVDLSDRSAFANRNNADLFISLHCNASPRSKAVKGTETFVMGLHKTDGNLEVAKRENSVILKETNYQQKYKGFDPNSPLAYIMLANYQSAFLTNSLRFAQLVENNFARHRSSRGVKQAGFLVLWRTTMPSVLVEIGFLSSPEEEQYLISEKGNAENAERLLKAFGEYKKAVEIGE
ncbi:MAG: N-acetylmuramoyl-L-alanine amidase [Cytophagaceae bacterium SCN 52-12]|nr:MAG: N-acetylmuramoyl-L-alanine amidase [Cytophagaceae bacterium SCN 52-12]